MEIAHSLISEVDLLFFVDIVWDPSEFVSEVDLDGVVVRTFSC